MTQQHAITPSSLRTWWTVRPRLAMRVAWSQDSQSTLALSHSRRIPVGWWAFEAPATSGCNGAEVQDPSYLTPGMTADGFVTGGCVYLLALLRWLKALGMRAMIDMHSLPGGAVKNMGYTGRHFDAARFFDGAVEW